MIRHIVFFSAKEKSYENDIYKGLSLLRDIPHCKLIEVQRNLGLDTLSKDEVDFIVYAEFESAAQLDAYKAHPLYQKAIDIVRPLRNLRVVGDLLSTE
ncbi:MAG: Dabb family protein [Rhizobiaceae bacterium]